LHVNVRLPASVRIAYASRPSYVFRSSDPRGERRTRELRESPQHDPLRAVPGFDRELGPADPAQVGSQFVGQALPLPARTAQYPGRRP
jgi:hypothetical protein